MPEIRWGKYILVFLITVSVFGTAFIASNFFYERRLKEVDEIERRISLNLLSSEVQYALLSETPCLATSSPVLGEEINALASRVEFLETERGSGDSEVQFLKSRYSLLQIKDLLLVKDIVKRCGGPAYTVVYFYSNTPGACDACERQGYVLTALRRAYPELKVYAFDYDLNLGSIDALKRIYGLRRDLPALVVERIPYYGFHDIEAVERLLPGISTTTQRARSKE
ncbi:MAG: hypothetical protein AAB539_02025 [Patescibacteria group bacterium]